MAEGRGEAQRAQADVAQGGRGGTGCILLKEIFDEVVGFVELDKLESELIVHPLVTRLGHIRQLGLAGSVFPGATHTRLSHSIGTMYYAGRIADALTSRTPSEIDDSDFRRKVRAAALLHDIGHPPLSHPIEHLLQDAYNSESVSEIFKTTPESGGMSTHPTSLAIRALKPQGNPFDNSLVSAYLVGESPLAPTIKDNGLDPSEISQIIAGQHPREFYNQILDGGLDADKLDYLQRDRHATGIAYGTFDVEHIIRNLAVEHDRLYVGEDAAQACLHFVLMRYFWHTQIIQNKNVSILERMAKIAYAAMAAEGIVPTPVDILDILNGIKAEDEKALEKWSQFTDDLFFTGMRLILSKIRNNEKLSYSEIPADVMKDMIERIQTGRPLTCAVRIDGVEVMHTGAQGRQYWNNQHPRYTHYQSLLKWIDEHKSVDRNMSRIIVTHAKIDLIKPLEAEGPILIKTPYDSTPSPLQNHYYSMILPMAAASEQLPIRFAVNRVYCVDVLTDELRKVWADLVSESEGSP